jgi:tetratricopeptide (TPR) repeat protein
LEIRRSTIPKGGDTSTDTSATSVFSVRYERNPYFTGRNEFLDNLCRELSDRRFKRYNHRIALHGLGGVGKTQIALEYAYTHKLDYNYIFWISAVDQVELLSGFVDIAKITQCVKSDEKPQDVAKSVLQWLEVTEGWLLIIDNLDNIEVANEYLPTTSGIGHTLITTRNKNSDDIPAEGMEVMVMGSDECVKLLLDRIHIANTDLIQAEARNIVEALGFLPLAIEQAAAYVRESNDLFEFLPTYKAHKHALLSRLPRGNVSYKKSVATTWDMSLQCLHRESPTAVKLMELLAFLNPDEILVKFLTSGSSGLCLESQAIFHNDFVLTENMKALETFSLIKVWDGGNKITLHRLVQAVIIEGLDEINRDDLVAEALEIGITAFPTTADGGDNSSREICREYRSQVMACLQHETTAQSEGSDLKHCRKHLLSARMALYLHSDGYYAEALKVWIMTVDLRIKILGEAHELTLESQMGLGWTYVNLGQYLEAAATFNQVRETTCANYGLHHQQAIESMNGLAWLYRQQDRPLEAIELHQKVYDISVIISGSEEIRTVTFLNELAWDYLAIKSWEKAAELHQKALEYRKRVQGLHHPDTMWSMAGVACAYGGLRRYEEAIEMHKEALDLRTRVLGLKHVDTIWSMETLADTYWGSGQYETAIELHEKALNVKVKAIPANHPTTLTSMEVLTREYSAVGRHTDAAVMRQRLLDVSKGATVVSCARSTSLLNLG